MRWVQWHGKTWETTDDEGQLSVHLWPPYAACPCVAWSWSLSHVVRAEDGAKPNEVVRHLSIDITDLHFFEPDRRRLAGRGIGVARGGRSHHRVRSAGGYAGGGDGDPDEGRRRERSGRAQLAALGGHAWVLRCGALDGWRIPCELDAWLIPREEYDRTLPETAEEVARFPDGPPNLRVTACADFTGGTVLVPRTRERPSRWARRALREVIGCRTIGTTRLSVDGVAATEEAWDGTATGPSATVGFSTR